MVDRVPRVWWTHADYSRLCENHFFINDFEKERNDKTRGRKQKRGALVRKGLKGEAIPSVCDLSKVMPSPHTTKMASREFIGSYGATDT